MKSLKKIELKDISEVAKMLKDFWKSQLVEASDNDILEDIRRMLDPECISYLVCYNDDIAGFVFVNEKFGYFNNIEYLYIKDEYRNKGLGSYCLSNIIEIVKKKQNGPRVQIEVSPSNINAMKLYHRLGFNHIDTITLSTKLDGEIIKKEVFGMDFYMNPKSLFDKNN